MQVSQTLSDLTGDDENLFSDALFRLIEVLEKAGLPIIDIEVLSCAAVQAYYVKHQEQEDMLIERILNK